MSTCVTTDNGSSKPVLVEAGKYCVVSDMVGKLFALEPKKYSLLHYKDGANPAHLADGSSDCPIVLKSLEEKINSNFESLIVQETGGRVLAAKPDDTKGKQILVFEAGALGWEGKNAGSHCFPNEDIVEIDDEVPVLAAWDDCGPNGQSCLRKVSKDFVMSLLLTDDEFDMISFARGLCKNSLETDELTDDEKANIKKLSIICKEDTKSKDGCERTPTLVIGDLEEEADIGQGAYLTFEGSTPAGATYGSMGSLSQINGPTDLWTLAGGKFTISKSGTYHFTIHTGVYPIGGGSSTYVRPFKNDTASGVDIGAFKSPGSAAPPLTTAWLGQLAMGDTFEFKHRDDAGSGGTGNIIVTAIKLG